MIHQTDEIIGKGRDRELFDLAQRLRLAMPAHIKADQPNAGRGLIETERLIDVASQPVLEHERQTRPSSR